MGMTPAVSLTTQSLQPVQAFADGETQVSGSLTCTETSLGEYGAITIPTTFSLSGDCGSEKKTFSGNDLSVTWSPSDPSNTSAPGTYTATAVATYTNSEATPETFVITGTKTLDIVAAQVSLSAPESVAVVDPANLSSEEEQAIKDAVVVAYANNSSKTLKQTDDYTVTLGAVEDGTCTCTVALVNTTNYKFENNVDTVDVTVTTEATPETPGTITVGGNTFSVALDPEAPAAYYYNGTQQAPAVVFANVDQTNPNAPQAPAAGTYVIRYALEGDNVIGATTAPTNAGTYNVTVTVNEGTATEKTVQAGTYTINVADIEDQTQIAVTWNGQPVADGDTISMNSISQYQTALKLAYPNGNLVDPSLYTVTQGGTAEAPTLVITVVNAPGAPVNITGGPINLVCETAYFNIASAEIDPTWLEDNPQVYTGAQIDIDDENINVYAANGAKLAQTAIFASASADGPFNLETDLANFNGLSPVAGKDGVYTDGETTPTYYKELQNWVANAAANKNAGQGTMIITGVNNYAGQANAVFTIAPYNVDDLDVTLANAANLTYTSQAITPAATVASPQSGATVAGVDATAVTAEKNKNKQFTITYANNVNATTNTSKATATITSNDPNFEGEKVIEFDIAKFNISNAAGKDTTAANLPFVKGSKNYNAQVLSVVSGLEVGTAVKTPVAMVAGVDYDVVQNTEANGDTSKGAIGSLDSQFPGTASNQVAINYAIVGKGNYEGFVNGTYYVTNNSLDKYIESATAPVNVQYNGTAQKPNFNVVLNVPDTDKGTSTTTISKDELAAYGLAVTYGNNTNASDQATITISAAGKVENSTTAYYGTYPTYKWTIAPADLTGATFGILWPEGETSFDYTGEQIKPAVADAKADDASVANGSANKGIITTAKGTKIALENIKDEYTVTYGANVNAGTNAGTVTIAPVSGNTNLTGSAVVKFDIEKATITDANVRVSATGVLKEHANGATYAEPEVIVTINNKTLVRDVDYTVTVSNNQQPGDSAICTVKGIGNYVGIVNKTFTVVEDIANATITMPTTDYVYDGSEKKPEPVVTIKSGNATTKLVLNTDYTLSYKNNINAGTATVIIKGAGTYGGQVEKTFTIAQAEGTLAVDAVAGATYTGSAITPEPDFTFTVGTTEYAKADLEAGVDYKYVYANNINSKAVSGKNATVTVQMIGNYGAKDGAVEFEIAQADVANATAIVGDVVVGGTPKVAVSMGDVALKEGTDYTFAADTKTPGTKTATITGKGNYTGTQKVTFVVLKENQVLPGDTDLTGGTWAKVDGKWQYTTKDDKLVSSGWAEINNKWYYFDSKGNAQTGWLELNGTWYYLNKAGEGTECAMVSNAWKKINGIWYHFAKSGAMQTGWQKINGAWYYLAKSGAMQTGWQKINGAWYYLNKAGQGTEGAMKTGWFNDNGTWYYLLKAGEGTEGKMVSNQWKQINGSWFYFYAGGAMAANTWVGNYYVDANGYWVR